MAAADACSPLLARRLEEPHDELSGICPGQLRTYRNISLELLTAADRVVGSIRGWGVSASASGAGAKKEAQRLEKAAKSAAKTAKAPPAATSAPAGEKKKPAKEKETKTEEAPFVNDTPAGEKQDFSEPMAAGYNPIAVESAWYDWWNKEGYFKPQMGPDGKPKPEGQYRMLGKTTLFVAGYDHAGISTQSVVEKRLCKATGQTRHDLGREKFLETVWDWKHDYQGRITKQMERLGGSYD
ncbi:hypothetical protein FRC07_011470 [Ceratobasidium sp. 392]|nr:hypothetical protein FRC07_011470 [Ceratobasidium sp. 392]